MSSSIPATMDPKRYDWSWFRARQEQEPAASEEPAGPVATSARPAFPPAPLPRAAAARPETTPEAPHSRVVVTPSSESEARPAQAPARQDEAQIHDLLAEMEEELAVCRRLPFSRSVFMDPGVFLDIIEEIRSSLPKTILEAEQIKRHKHQIIEEAQDRSNDYLARAQREADRLIDEERIVQRARERAKEILDQAQSEAARLRADAEDEAHAIRAQAEQEVDELYDRLGENLQRILGQLKR